MPKEVNLLPNLRIDIPDFEAGTTSFSKESFKNFVKNTLLTNMAAVGEGFRVEIANQATNPGLFTIYNGTAFDRSGLIVNNETEFNANKSQTLLVDATYYIEIEFTSTESDTDQRAFWDPTFDNGNDPSGDPRASGKEFAQNVATRITPDWQIVSPPSTTAFQYTTDADSLRIPIAVLTVTGGVIAGGTAAAARTTLAADAAMSATTVKVLNSRILPDSFTATIGGVTVSVTDNDRENGMLSLSAGLAAAHSVGERVINTTAGAAQYLADRAVAAIPSSGTADARPRLWQGDENRGYALAQDPLATTGNADAQIAKLKDYVDFLAGQIRELKFGSQRDVDLGNLAPPVEFAEVPRYYDLSSGVQGARTAHVTIGDGVTTWGDLNQNQFDSDNELLDAAFLACAEFDAGVIYLKPAVQLQTWDGDVAVPAGKYRFIGNVPRSLSDYTFNGDGFGFVCSSSSTSVLEFENCSFQVNSGSADGNMIALHTGWSLTLKNCAISYTGSTTYIQPFVIVNSSATSLNTVLFDSLNITVTRDGVKNNTDTYFFDNGTAQIANFVARDLNISFTWDDDTANSAALFRFDSANDTDYWGNISFREIIVSSTTTGSASAPYVIYYEDNMLLGTVASANYIGVSKNGVVRRVRFPTLSSQTQYHHDIEFTGDVEVVGDVTATNYKHGNKIRTISAFAGTSSAPSEPLWSWSSTGGYVRPLDPAPGHWIMPLNFDEDKKIDFLVIYVRRDPSFQWDFTLYSVEGATVSSRGTASSTLGAAGWEAVVLTPASLTFEGDAGYWIQCDVTGDGSLRLYSVAVVYSEP